MQGLIRHLPAVRRILKERPTSVDLERVEFGAPRAPARHPVRADAARRRGAQAQMDSLLKSYRFVHNLNERMAVMACDKFLCVNPIITERIRATYPRQAWKIDTLSTWVDTATFRPRPLPAGAGLRIATQAASTSSSRPRSCSRPSPSFTAASGTASSFTISARASPSLRRVQGHRGHHRSPRLQGREGRRRGVRQRSRRHPDLGVRGDAVLRAGMLPPAARCARCICRSSNAS